MGKGRKVLSGILSAALIMMSLCNGLVAHASGGTLAGSVELNKTNFPDGALLWELKDKSDKDKDGWLSPLEIEATRILDISGKTVSNMQGLEYLTGLEELYCSNNNIPEINTSKNTKLKILDCSNNSITNLNISNSKNLERLEMKNNNLVAVNLSNNSELRYIDVQDNSLNSLNVSSCVKLEELYCQNNKIPSLDLSSCNNMLSLRCENNKLLSLNLGLNKLMYHCRCENNLFDELDISECDKLKSIYNAYKQFDCETYYAYCYEKTYIEDDYGKSYFLSVNKNVKLSLIKEDLSGIAIDKDNFPDANFREFVKTLDKDGNGRLLPEERVAVKEIDLPKYAKSIGKEGLTFGTLKGIEYFGELETLKCQNCGVSTLEIWGNPKLKVLFCGSNDIINLNLSNNINLEDLRCDGNNYTSLDVSNNTKLIYFECSGSKLLTSIIIGDQPLLEEVNCMLGNIKTIDLGNCPNLRRLTAYFNKLTTLDIRECDILRELAKKEPKLEKDSTFGDWYFYNDGYDKKMSIDAYVTLVANADGVVINETNFPDANFRAIVSGSDIDTDSDKGFLSVSELRNVTLLNLIPKDKSKKIKSLKGIEYFSRLITLWAGQNDLTYSKDSPLSFEGNPILRELDLADSENLQKIDITHNPNLSYLEIENTGIDGLNISQNPDLYKLSAYGSKINLHTLDIRNNQYLIEAVVYGTKKDIDYRHIYTSAYKATVIVNGTAYNVPDICVASLDEKTFPNKDFREYLAHGYGETNKNWLDWNQDGILTNNEAASVKNLFFEDYESTPGDKTTLEGISLFQNLEYLSCFNNGITAADLNSNKKLKYIDLGGNNLTKLDVSKLSKLSELIVTNNTDLKELNLPNETKNLVNLECGMCNLSSLDVTPYGNLTELSCYQNNLDSIDVSKNGSLEELFCFDNNLKSLDVSKNYNLKKLSCGYNANLTTIDLTKNLALKDLNISKTGIKSINLARNVELTSLYAANGVLTGLDLSKNTKLCNLFCYGNPITELDISSVPALVDTVTNGTKKTAQDTETGNIYLMYYKGPSSDLRVDETVTIYTSPKPNNNPEKNPSGNSGTENGKQPNTTSPEKDNGKKITGVGTISADGKTLTDESGKKFKTAEKLTAADLKPNAKIADKKSGGKYRITKLVKDKKTGKVTGGNVEYMAPYNKNCKLISATGIVKLGGVKFKVTSIASSCAKGCKKLTKVIIGSYVTNIGKNAFSGCSKLKTITIKGTKLKKIGSNAFKGINKKAMISVPKAKKKAYTKLLKGKGQAKAVKIK